MPKLLIVDDDRALLGILQDVLEQDGYQVVSASDGLTALQQVAAEQPDLLLLDLLLPDVDGTLLMDKIRRTSTVPIIVVSGRQQQVDRVVSLKMGADDFVGKPFDLDDLEARIEAVLRRSKRTGPAQSLVPGQPMPGHLGLLSVTNRSGASLDGVPFDLTPTELRMLQALVAHPDETQTRSELAQAVWGYGSEPSTGHLVDVHIHRLRCKVRRLGPSAPCITTTRGRGYLITEPVL